MAAIAGPAAASPNLVKNPGFETGDFTDWSVNAVYTSVSSTDGSPNTGTYAAFFGQPASPGSISQTIATTAGQAYTFSFYFASDGNTPNEFQAYFGDTKVFDALNSRAFGYTLESFTVAATSANTTITFAGTNDPGYMALDDVSVTAVPEPATLAVLGSALFGLGALRRRTCG